MSIYLDSSFLVSLYSTSVHSEAAIRALRSSATLWVSTFAEIEVVNALCLRLFRNEDSAAEIQHALEAFDEDLLTGRFQVRPLPERALQKARQLSLETTAQLGTRASDILQVAAALELGAEQFYSFDNRQRKLAENMKLKLNQV